MARHTSETERRGHVRRGLCGTVALLGVLASFTVVWSDLTV